MNYLKEKTDRLCCPWKFPGKNTGMGCHFLLQGILPDPGIESMSPVSLALTDSSPLCHLGGKNTQKNYTKKVLMTWITMKVWSFI